MVKTRGGHTFRHRVRRSSPLSAAPIQALQPLPHLQLLPLPPPLLFQPLRLPPPLCLPLLPLRAVLLWAPPLLLLPPIPLMLLPLPQGDTTLRLAPLHPLRHILSHSKGPHDPREPGPRAQENPPALGLRSHSHHPIRALLEPLLWTCPQPPSSGGHSSTTALFQGMLIVVGGICTTRFTMISRPLPKT